MAKQDPIREGEYHIEIDVQKGAWPFTKLMWGEDQRGRTKLLIHLDENEGGVVMGEGKGQATIMLSKKKARRLRDFLVRTLDD